MPSTYPPLPYPACKQPGHQGRHVTQRWRSWGARFYSNLVRLCNNLFRMQGKNALRLLGPRWLACGFPGCIGCIVLIYSNLYIHKCPLYPRERMLLVSTGWALACLWVVSPAKSVVVKCFPIVITSDSEIKTIKSYSGRLQDVVNFWSREV